MGIGWVAVAATVCVLGSLSCGERQEFAIDTARLPNLGVEWALTGEQICAGNKSPS